MKPQTIFLAVMFLFLSVQLSFGKEDPCKVIYHLYSISCVRTPCNKISQSCFSRAGMGAYDYYSNVINENNFWVYCSEAEKNNL
jgi:hypothetical protein